ncbi:beta-xylosidase [Pedobacter frigidisoli]|uniref:Beta-xylosidase n=1 Tax=Pedobacter frigidisoli TaxID=2530455 RepID=A0A4R0P6W8_9SPHI|nr:glycoside hydrolase family 43 protein [Pedobacter frigidisoli]TCD11252.1 beta-xylosidase [Pedobacter frigidisoli]
MRNHFLIFIILILNFSNISAKKSIEIYKNTDTIYVADPTIFLDKGTYYLYGTSSDKGFEVYQSTDLKKWTGPVGKNIGFALSKGESYGSKGFWAPQVFKQGEKYFIAYTANEHIAVAESDNPLGPFTQKKIKSLPGKGLQIDPFIFVDTDGKTYLYHVRLGNGNRIFVAEMKPDFSDIIPETLKECITASQPWENTEKTGWPVTEGPTVLKKENLYYLFYSANDFRSPDYAVGYATSNSPFGPWKKFERNPIISRKTLNYNGTGHGDFFTDQKGTLQYVFHTHYSNKLVSPRATAIISAKFMKQKDGSFEMKVDPSTMRFLTK